MVQFLRINSSSHSPADRPFAHSSSSQGDRSSAHSIRQQGNNSPLQPSQPPITMQTWRKLEGLPDTAPLYEVTHLGLYSPYPVELTPDEYRLAHSLRRLFPPTQILLDSYFTRPRANTSQIDCLALSRSGLFVFESKGYEGWIFGSGRRQNWTQILAYGTERHTFYNPVYQNQNHIKNLQHALGPDLQFYSIIVFSSQATFKNLTDLPPNCYVCHQNQVVKLVQSITARELSLTQPQIDRLNRQLRRARIPVTPHLRQRHNQRINHSA